MASSIVTAFHLQKHRILKVGCKKAQVNIKFQNMSEIKKYLSTQTLGTFIVEFHSTLTLFHTNTTMQHTYLEEIGEP